MNEEPLYERVGGEEFFRELVAAFYDGIATDALLAPLARRAVRRV